MTEPVAYTDEQLLALAEKLLTHAETHLVEQFKAGRIIGTDFAQVYIAAMQGSMSQAQAFLLGKDLAASQVNTQNEQWDVLKERHGMNHIPAFTQPTV